MNIINKILVVAVLLTSSVWASDTPLVFPDVIADTDVAPLRLIVGEVGYVKGSDVQTTDKIVHGFFVANYGIRTAEDVYLGYVQMSFAPFEADTERPTSISIESKRYGLVQHVCPDGRCWSGCHEFNLNDELHPGELYIDYFIILEYFQGQGYGSAVMRLLVNHFKHLPFTPHVTLMPACEELFDFYSTFGFIKTQRVYDMELPLITSAPAG